MLTWFRSRSFPIAGPTLAALVLYLNACVGYSERRIPPDQPLVIGPDKFLILHIGGSGFALDAPQVDKNGIRGHIRRVWSGLETRSNQTPGAEAPLFRNLPANPAPGASPMPGKSQRVDIWLKGDTHDAGDSSGFFLRWAEVDRISIYDVSIGKTLLYWTAGTIGVMAIAFIIFLLTKSSCPFVYADNGTGYDFQGEIFSGAIYPQLERRDWMPLPAPTGPGYRLRITNEVKEIQHLDAASLWLVRHPQGTGVLLDVEGRPHTFEATIAPVRCVSVSGRDAAASIAARDSLFYMGGEGDSAGKWLDGLDLEFPKPAGARSAKLILRAKNSFWLDYLYGQFQDLFGNGLESWNGKMRKAPPEKLAAWFKEQNLPLTVEMAGPRGWSEVASLSLPGPMAARDFLVPITLPPSGSATADTVRLRLRCGFLFWEIDYAALDFSPDRATEIVRIPAVTAADQDGRDLRALLAEEDGKHYDQPRVGDAAELAFALPEKPAGLSQSAFLACRGYYDILRKPEGKPRMADLKRFRSPGTLARFSAERMMEQIHGR